MAILGKNMKVKVQGQIVALALDCELTENLDLRETSSPTSGRAKTYIGGRTGWRITTSHMMSVAAHRSMRYVLHRGQEVSVEFEVVGLDYTLSGNAFVTNIGTNGAVNRLGRMALELTGSGELA